MFFRSWLRDCVGTVEKEDGDLFVRLIADVDPAVRALGGLIPIHLPGCDVEALARRAIAVFDRQGSAMQHHADPVKGIAVPGHGFTRRERHPPDERCPTVEEHFLGHACPSLRVPDYRLGIYGTRN